MKTRMVTADISHPEIGSWVKWNSDSGDTLAILTPDEVAAIVVTEEVENAAAEIFCGGATGGAMVLATFIRTLCHAQQKAGT